MELEKMDLAFTVQDLSFDDNPPKKEDFLNFEKEFKECKDNGDHKVYYTIRTDLTDSYFWMSGAFGSPDPRPENVLNIDNFSLSDNPRQANEVEQKEQFFMVFTFCDSTMYLYNIRQKGFIQKLCENKLKKPVIIKDIFKTLDEFYAAIKQVDKICFTSQKKDLFSRTGTINQVLTDNYGMEEPDEFFIEARYHTPISAKVRHTIERLRSDTHLRRVIIKGRDDHNFEKVFNNDTFTQKMIIKVEKHQDGLFSELKVKEAVFEQLREKINVHQT